MKTINVYHLVLTVMCLCPGTELFILAEDSEEEGHKMDRSKKQNFAQSQTGRRVQSLTASQTVGRDGPILLADSNLLETLAHFNRERIPERPAHAKGFGAFGEFEVTHDDPITQYTKAGLFSRKGKKTKIFVRFSTVAGELGASDIPVNPPDPRGFAIKFYTEEGNWDLTGNNLAIFPIRDPILFPSLLRSRKRNPRTHLPDPTAYWDFTSLRPETTFHTIQLFSDLGYPDGVRFMDGAGVHTFKLVNKEGEMVYCKFHYISQQGSGKNVTFEQGHMLPADYAIKDLHEAIETKKFPSWKLYIQVMTFEQAAESKFNPFDITKLWPEKKYPLIPVGKFVLNQNPRNFFTQVEMSSFDPGNMVPGIEPSPDRMLHARMFAYADAQRYRLGVNFLQLPVNRPIGQKYPKTYHRDGFCFHSKNNEDGPDYFPNSFGHGPTADYEARESKYSVTGDVDRLDIGEEDNFSQASEFYNKMPRAEQLRTAQNLARGLKVTPQSIQERALHNFQAVSKKLTNDIRHAMVKRVL